jgi:exopolysaccharide biosynthesis protein
VYFGNRTHEEFTSSNNIKSGNDFVKTHNLFYEYDIGGTKHQVHGHYSVVEDPLQTFSILEPENVGGCNKSARAKVSDTAKQRNCVVATNAGYFRTKNGHCLGNIFSDGRKVLDAQGIQNVNFGIRKDGTIITGYLSEEMVLDIENPFVQLVSGVVWLIRRGDVYVNQSKKIECEDLEETGSVDLFVNVVSGRTALGHDAQGNVVLVQVDGRTHHRGSV